jgi:hypothetical protein
VADSFEHGNEPSGFIKGRGFAKPRAERLAASYEGLYSMERINNYVSSYELYRSIKNSCR